MALPSYINRHGDLVLPQPYAGSGTHFTGFMVPFNEEAAQTNLIDRYLNNPAGWGKRFVSAIPFASFAFCSIDKLTCLTPPYDSWGYFSESEVAIWMLLRDTQENTVCWFQPYMFVNNPLAMSMGREVFGFPKQIGQIQMEEEHYLLEAMTLKQFKSSEKGAFTPLIEITCNKPDPTDIQELENLGKLLEEMFKFMVENGGMHLLTEFHTIEGLLHGTMDSVFLKEFRDVANGAQACYQAVTVVPSVMSNIHNPRILNHDYRMEIFDCASEPIVQDLGLTSSVIKPTLAFSIDFDFTFQNGSELWRA